MILAELSTKQVKCSASALRRTCPRGRHCRSRPPAERQSLRSARAGGLRGRTPSGWPAGGHTSCWDRAAHLWQRELTGLLLAYINN